MLNSITNSWITYATTFGIPLSLGGGVAALVSLILAAIFQWIVLIGLAEFCSALPSSGVRLRATNIIPLVLTCHSRANITTHTLCLRPVRANLLRMSSGC